MSATRSCVIGRGVGEPCSLTRMAAASGWPIQIGRNLFPSKVLSSTIGCFPALFKRDPVDADLLHTSIMPPTAAEIGTRCDRDGRSWIRTRDLRLIRAAL